MLPPRITPPVCVQCGHKPWACPTCGDFQCNCPNEYQYKLALEEARRGAKPRRLVRQHYGRDGLPYPAQFLDNYVPGSEVDDD